MFDEAGNEWRSSIQQLRTCCTVMVYTPTY